jgi:hypothetical protein
MAPDRARFSSDQDGAGMAIGGIIFFIGAGLAYGGFSVRDESGWADLILGAAGSLMALGGLMLPFGYRQAEIDPIGGCVRRYWILLLLRLSVSKRSLDAFGRVALPMEGRFVPFETARIAFVVALDGVDGPPTPLCESTDFPRAFAQAKRAAAPAAAALPLRIPGRSGPSVVDPKALARASRPADRRRAPPQGGFERARIVRAHVSRFLFAVRCGLADGLLFPCELRSAFVLRVDTGFHAPLPLRPSRDPPRAADPGPWVPPISAVEADPAPHLRRTAGRRHPGGDGGAGLGGSDQP